MSDSNRSNHWADLARQLGAEVPVEIEQETNSEQDETVPAEPTASETSEVAFEEPEPEIAVVEPAAEEPFVESDDGHWDDVEELEEAGALEEDEQEPADAIVESSAPAEESGNHWNQLLGDLGVEVEDVVEPTEADVIPMDRPFPMAAPIAPRDETPLAKEAEHEAVESVERVETASAESAAAEAAATEEATDRGDQFGFGLGLDAWPPDTATAAESFVEAVSDTEDVEFAPELEEADVEPESIDEWGMAFEEEAEIKQEAEELDFEEEVEVEEVADGEVEVIEEPAERQRPKNRRRRRRRRKPKPNAAEPENQPGTGGETEQADVEPVAAELEGKDEPPQEIEPSGEEPAKRKRRRRRRRRKKPQSDESDASAVETDAVSDQAQEEPTISAESEDDEPKGSGTGSRGRGGRGGKSEPDTETAEKAEKSGQRSIPSWDEAIDTVIAKNLEARKKSGDGGGSRRRRRRSGGKSSR